MRQSIWAAVVCGLVGGSRAPGDDPPRPRPSQAELLQQAQAGPEHARLGKLAGKWTVEMRTPPANPQLTMTGAGTAATIIGGRFVAIDAALAGGGQNLEARFTLGFDRRHGEYTIHVVDTYGTYAVTARGAPQDGTILMFGEDDDPLMQSMGLQKKFAFSLDVKSDDHFVLGIHFLDTRRPEERRRHYMDYEFRRVVE